MKTKPCLFALWLVSGFLPVVTLTTGIELMSVKADSERPPGNKPRLRMMGVSPVVIEIEPGVINLTFTRDQGVVDLQLQDPTAMPIASQAIDTSVQNQASIHLPAGTYFLTVTTASEEILTEAILVIP